MVWLGKVKYGANIYLAMIRWGKDSDADLEDW